MTIDERIASELRRHVPEVDEHTAWTRIQSAAPARRRTRAIRQVSISMAALGLLVLGFIVVPNLPSGPAPASDPRSPYVGTWVTTDLDGSTPTMTVEVSTDGTVVIAVYDDFASVCSGASSTMVGAGSLLNDTELAIPQLVLTCEDGSVPEALSGPPLEEQLRDMRFVYDPVSDTLTDNFGSVWGHEGAEQPDPDPSTSILWPQSSVDEAREAQRLADAGDLAYTWQLEPGLEESLMTSPAHLDIQEIFARFLRDELGWEEFSRLPGPGFGAGTIILTFVRCAPGQSNSIYPDDPRGGWCAPTMDDVRYETVAITVAQPVRQGSDGIWVVTQWDHLKPIEQVIPISDAEATAILEAFLQARVDGEGAEQYFGGGDGTAPLLYATSSGSPFERYEFELVSGPEWPNDPRRYNVRLFADGGQTVVESSIRVESDASGDWGVENATETLENGQTLAEQYHDILGGEVSFLTSQDWEGFFGPSFGSEGRWADATLWLNRGVPELSGSFRVLADPRTSKTGCDEGSVPANAEALAQNIMSLPDFDVTAPVAVTIGEAPALQMDVVKSGTAIGCDEWPRLAVVNGIIDPVEATDPARRMRLYLVDLPGGTARVLSIAIIAPEDAFDKVVELAAPILESFEFHTG